MKNADPKTPTTQKIFEAVINEDDASHLIGGIVEKGFSEQPLNGSTSWTFAPRPSVLPFPVPRHRSHGPHWAPKVGDVCGNNDHDDEENEEEEEDFAGINQIGNFAKPVQRKEKKGMDFCNWQEIVASDNSSVPYKREERGRKVNSTLKERKAVAEASQNKNNSNERPPDENGNGASLSVEDGTKSQDVIMEDEHLVQEKEEDMAMDIEQGGVEQSNHSVLPQQKCGNGSTEQEEEIIENMHPSLQVNAQKCNISANKGHASFDSEEVEGRHNASNLESQIDAENRAQLARMSADEIAEAQAELLAKLSPAVLEALKRKGQEKLKREKSYRSGSHLSGEKGSLLDQMKNEISQGTQKKKVEDDTPKLNASTSVWDEWSKRVESVRELRFSFDGNIMKSELEVPKSGVSVAQDLSERDYLRTEGDPGAAGYTIKEAVALTRSAVAGQRTIALHLIASVLDRAICRIHQNQLGCILRSQDRDGFNDWEAIWAFILGPEPELALSLRMSLDDNHRSVVLACARAIQCALSFEINEDFFEIVERIPTLQRDAPTAPVFRSRPEIEDGFLHGGFWKYNTKPSNILPSVRDSLENDESEGTIQDDVVVAGQDIAAGLIRMGILQRIQYLLETEPSAALEECLISILIAIARHSPTCADAIMKCQWLVQTIINRFTSKEHMEISISKIKSVALLRILARSDKENCLEFIKTGIFQKMIWQLYRYTSFDQWVKSGKEACKLSSALLVEQLRLWKVCVQHGYCVSYFADLFPALCIWLNVPAFGKLIENSVLSEYAAIAKEAYLVLGALTRRLPIFYSHMQQLDRGTTKEAENWCWAHVGPMIDSALEWIRLKKIPLLSRLFEWQNEEKLNGDIQDSAVSPLLWLISSIMDMLSAVLEAVIPEDNAELHHGSLPWLPDFVPKIGLEILKNGLMSFSGWLSANHDSSAGSGSFLECLCYLRKLNRRETSIASSSCLQGLLRVAWCVDKLILLANNEPRDLFAKYQSFSREEKTLADGILHSSLPELITLMTSLVESNGSKWRHMKSIETFGRGGPAPGIGVGWGAPGGGFWSKHILSAQVDARLFIYLLDVFPIVSVKDQFTTEGMSSIMQKINSVMEACLLLGPMDSSAVDKLLDFLFQVPTLKYIDFSIRQFLTLKQGYQSLERVYEEEDYLLLSDVLASHFKKRWLSAKHKRKSAAGDEHVCRKNPKKGSILLDAIPEEISASNPTSQEPKCLVAEWAHQRLHLPLHWFLSPLSVLCSTSHGTLDFLKVAKGGLFFLLGIELMSNSLPAELLTPVRNVPVVWKLHALSATLLSGMDIFEEENSRDLYKALQDVYGQLLDREEKVDAKKLKFKTDIQENYSTFIDNLVEQFAAVSYGDMIFGRQVGIYLHHFVEAPVRLAAWNALSNACALELLPPLEKCIAATCGYLEPVEDDERMLETYCKSWVSGALDKAASRGSASFTLALHHLSSFIFQTCSGNMLPLRNKLAKSLLRDYSRKKQHESLFINLLEYLRPDTRSEMPQHSCNVENRLQILKEACEGNSSLLSEVKKLSAVIRRKQHVRS